MGVCHRHWSQRGWDITKNACILILALCLAGAAAGADVPSLVNYQGRLWNQSGGPVDGSVSMSFSLYEGPGAEGEVRDEAVVLAGVEGHSLARDHLVVESIVVLNAGGDDTYVYDADYWIDEENGEIGRFEAGSIQDGETVLVSYRYLVDELWNESYPEVVVRDGLYSVVLGSVNPLGPEVFAGGEAYLSVSVAGEELLPRQQITSVAYSIKAQDAHTIDGKSADEIGTIRKIEVGDGLEVENPSGPTVSIRRAVTDDLVPDSTFYGLVPPNDLYAAGNIFYIDMDNGDDGNDGLSPEEAFLTWWRATNTASGAVWGVQGPVKIVILGSADPDRALETLALLRENCCVVGVNYPLIRGNVACTLTVCGANAIIAGLKVDHPIGNGIDITPSLDGLHVPDDTVVVGNIFVESGVGAAVNIQADRVFVTHNRILGGNTGVLMGLAPYPVNHVTVSHNSIWGKGLSAGEVGIRFMDAEACLSNDNRIVLRTTGIWFDAQSKDCRSIDDIVDIGLAGYHDEGTGNIFWTPHE